MTGESIRLIAKELVEEELKGRRLNEKYKASIRESQKNFIDWAVKRSKGDLRLITKADLVKYHQSLAQTKSKRDGNLLSPTTINDRYHAVCMLFSLLYRAGILKENPTHNLNLDLPNPTSWKRRPLTQEEITTFLENIDPSTKQGLKDRTMFELMYSSGLRVCEVANLKVGDINFEKREMIVRGKFERDRVVPISKVAKDFLLLFLDERISERESPVFLGFRGSRENEPLRSESVSERFHDLLRKFKMDKAELSAHSIRHSTATHLLENGASVRHVQELLGHKTIETTVRYTHVQTDSLAKIYRKYHPREHELFEVIDDSYMKRFNDMLKANGYNEREEKQ